MRMPVRLIWGTDDPLFPIAKARRMTPSFAGGADFRQIAGAKLYSHEDHPDEYVAAARPFLRSVLLSLPGPTSQPVPGGMARAST
jgi:pimeloyl-ACP methyl ester carboxylesterase